MVYKKEWPTAAEASKEERRKKRPFLPKMRPYRQRQKERFEMLARPIIMINKMNIP